MKNNFLSHFNAHTTRRSFISNITKTFLYTAPLHIITPLFFSCSSPRAKRKPSLVSVVKSNSLSHSDGNFDTAQLQKLLNHAILHITGYSDSTKAWNSLFFSNDKVAIKINCLGKRIGSTKPSLTYAVAECLNKYVNIPYNNITIFDRSEGELIGAGYTINQSSKGIKVVSTLSYPYSPKIKSRDIETPLTSIIANQCTALINLSLLKTHSGAGVSLSFKNHYGSIPKEVVQDDSLGYHARNFKNLVDLNAMELLRNKTRLCIVDSLVGQFHAGPEGNPRYQWKYNGLIMGIDPVAVDTTALNIINDKRLENNLHPLKIPYLNWAEEEGLGVCHQDLITVSQHIL